MANDDLLSRISIDPNIGFGKPCIRGHRIWVPLILDSLRSTFEERREAIHTLIAGLKQADDIGKLWVIQNNRIQEYQPIESEE